MSEKVTDVTKDILPDEKIDCVAYGCTSGTIAAGYDSIVKRIKKANFKIKENETDSIAELKKIKVYISISEFYKSDSFKIYYFSI